MKVKFEEINLPIIIYDKDEFKKNLRDKFAQVLVRRISRKLISEYEKTQKLIQIFENALKPKLSSKELAKIEPLVQKFDFLEYNNPKPGSVSTDDIIHEMAYKFMALCSEDKKTIMSSLPSWNIYDEHGNQFGYPLNYEYSRALCIDVANLTRECTKEFLQELKEFGRIFTSTELAQFLQTSVKTEDIDEDYPDDFEEYISDEESSTLKVSGEDNKIPDTTSSSSNNGNNGVNDATNNEQPENSLQHYNSNYTNFITKEPYELILSKPLKPYEHPDVTSEKQVYEEIIKEIEKQLEENVAITYISIKKENNTNEDGLVFESTGAFYPILHSEMQKEVKIPFSIIADPLMVSDVDAILGSQNQFKLMFTGAVPILY